MKWMLSLAAVALAGVAFLSSPILAGDDHEAKAKVGQPAPLFTLTDQTGKTHNLADFKDKVVVLEWFNEGCPFVKKFYVNGDMNTWAKSYADKGVVWIAVNSTKSSNNESDKKIAGDWKIDRPILSDADGTVGHAYGAKTTPHMFIINKGTLSYAGAIDAKPSADASDVKGSKNYVAQALDEILANKSVSEAETKAYGCSVKYAK